MLLIAGQVQPLTELPPPPPQDRSLAAGEYGIKNLYDVSRRACVVQRRAR